VTTTKHGTGALPQSILHVRLPCNKVWPLGVITLAGYIRQHHPHVRQQIIDLAVLPPKTRDAYLKAEIERFNPDVISVSWRDIQVFAPHEADASLENSFNFFYSNNAVKKLLASFSGLKMVAAYHANLRENLGHIKSLAKRYPDKKILLGGGAFSVFHEQLTKKLPKGVIGVIGEGEQAMSALIDGTNIDQQRVSYIKPNGQRVEGPTPPPLDLSETRIDYPYIKQIFSQWDAYKGFQVSIQTKRGCPYKCAYCLYPHIEGTQVSLRPPELVLEEMQFLYDELGARDFWFADAQFLTGRRALTNAEEICQGIIDRGLDIAWSGYVRTNSITPKLADLMVRSGVGDLEVGLASGSQTMVNEMKLGFKMENLFQGARNLKEAGYQHQLILNYSPNMPGETEETLLETVDSYRTFVSIMGEDQVFAMIFFIGVQPHTPLEDRLLAEGFLSKGYNPMSLNPISIKKLLYNPAPLNDPISKACLTAWEDGAEDSGKRVLFALEEILTARGATRPSLETAPPQEPVGQ